MAGPGRFLDANEGEAIWFLGNLMTVKAGATDTHDSFTLIEFESPPGFGPPPHIHRLEDEAFYVLSGRMTVSCGDDRWEAGPGGFVLLPRGIAHSFTASDAGPLKALQLTSPAQFELFAREFGEPARERAVPPTTEPDIPRLIEVMGKYNIDLADQQPRG